MSAGADGGALSERLRQYRIVAGLSQEALAERAGLSARGVSDLERGLRRVPHPSTLARLAEALGLSADDRAVLLAARSEALRPSPAADHALTLSPPRGTATRELTSFIGREHELATIGRLMAHAPLVTLAGPGGAGKTRLALRIAHDAQGYSMVVVELAEITDPRLVPRAVAAALGVSEAARRPLLESLISAVCARRLLLVMDNCEHLVAACAELVEALLRACPELQVLATSREPLGVEGEAILRVPPLGLPVGNDVSQCSSADAVQLFVQRACAARSDFVLDATTAPHVARICRRLDGLPLAIELAAARVASLSVAEIAARLQASGEFLSSPRRAAVRRQSTLQAAIAWSYTLLSDEERDVFERLSIFVGGFGLEEAEALSPRGTETLGLLESLVHRSMVQLEVQADGAARYRLLEPLRQFGRERLAERGEARAVAGQHARAMVAFVERTARGLEGPHQLEWYRRLDRDWPNVLGALNWAVENGEAQTSLRLVAPLWLYWCRPDRQADGRRRLEQVLAVSGVRAYPDLQARVMGILGVITFFQGDQLATGPLLEQALAAARAQADIWLEVFMLRLDGLVHLFGAEPVEAERLLLHARKLAQRAALRTMEASILGDLASVAVARGDLDAAEAHLRSSLRITHGGVDPWSEAMTINSLGDLLRARGDFAAAAAAYAEALPTLRAMNNDVAPPGMLHNFGYVALGRDDPRDALRLFLQSADGYRSIGGDRRALAECVIGMGAAAVRLGQAELAARLFGAAEATLEELGTSITPSNQADYERGRSELAGRLSPAQLAAYLAEGRRLSVEQALELGRSLSASTAVEVPMAGLTQRELEIARLLAQGYRNRQIAESLVITEKTVANHVQRVLDKLGVRSRAQVAARAADLGLA